MNARQLILVGLIDVAMDQACESINAGQFDQAILQWRECVSLTQQMALEHREFQEPKPDLQITIDLKP